MIVEVEYIESGTFCGGEEDCFNAEIESGAECVVLKKEIWEDIVKKIKYLAPTANPAIYSRQLEDIKLVVELKTLVK